MAEDVGSEGFDVLGGDVVAAFEEGGGFGGEGEVDGAARGGSAADEKLQVGGERAWIAGGMDEGDDVVADFFIHVDGVHDLPAGDDVFGVDDGADIELGSGSGHGVEDLALFFGGGVVDSDLEEEAVELSFGEGVGALLVDGVLRGEDEEGVREFVGVFADGDLAFLHGFEQGGLDFGGGAVDFVRENEIGEDGAEAGGEGAVFGVIDHGANDIGGEEVGGELDALEFGLDGGGEGADGEGFGEAGNAFEEDVAIGEESDEEAIDEVILTDEDAADFGAERIDPGSGGGYGFEVRNGGRGSGGGRGRRGGHRIEGEILGEGGRKGKWGVVQEEERFWAVI